MNRPVTATDFGNFINDAVQGQRRAALKIEALDMERRAQEAAERSIEAGAVQMMKRRWRITKAVYPYGAETGWPISKSPQTVLADCRSRIALEKARADHWTHDFNRLVGLQQAERALERMLTSQEAGSDE